MIELQSLKGLDFCFYSSWPFMWKNTKKEARVDVVLSAFCFFFHLDPPTHPKTPLMSWLLFAKDTPTIIRSSCQHFHWHCCQTNLCRLVLIVCCCSQQYLPTGYTKCDLTAKGKGWAQDHFLPHISFLCHNHLTSKICWNIISAISPNIKHLKL